MNILILGASSQIGREIALRFSSGNSLVLLGRNRETLVLIAGMCMDAGAESADVIEQDIAEGLEPLMQQIGNRSFDLVINLVSATSRVRDSEFMPGQLGCYLQADLLVPVQFIEILIERSTSPIKVIFISSVLAAVKSPDRLLYGSLKLLQEMSLHRLAECHPGVQLLVIKIGKVISHTQSSEKSEQLADMIYRAHLQNKEVVNYGLVGRLYLLLFYAQPLIFGLVVRLQRALRSSANLIG